MRECPSCSSKISLTARDCPACGEALGDLIDSADLDGVASEAATIRQDAA